MLFFYSPNKEQIPCYTMLILSGDITRELKYFSGSASTLVCFAPSISTNFLLVQGDPTYLVVEKDRTLATYGINAVCTHLGCVVPWNQAENKFICPCHGSQYNDQGRVVRGPAPLVS